MVHIRVFFKLFVLFLISVNCFGQFTLIPTGTSTAINNIIQTGNIVYISGHQNYFVKTYDAGTNLLPLTPHTNSPFFGYSLNCIDSTKIYVVSGWHNPVYQYKIKKSTDGGNSWTTLLDTSGLVILSMKMIDSLYGVAGSNLGTILTTSDGGNSWTAACTVCSDGFTINNFGDSVIYLAGGSGATRTFNQGNQWVGFPLTSGESISSIVFFTKDSMFCSAYGPTNDPGGFIFKTKDGFSMDDTVMNLGADNPLYDLKFFDHKVGAAVGYNTSVSHGVIFLTTDGGINWQKIQTIFNSQFYSILFLNDSIALIGGTNGVLLRWNWKQYLAVSELNFDNQIVIYPNPFINTVTLEIENFEKYSGHDLSFELHDLLGRTVKTEKISSKKTEIYKGSLKNGIYFWEVKEKEFKIISNGKIVIE